MKDEKLIFEVVAAVSGGGSHSQKGDVSQALADQGFFSQEEAETLKKRDKFLSGGNPVDVKRDFFQQNQN
jgi:hypothetical protein